ncbi:hypothetical protein HHI36_008841 [Cryptolaemus montrouzieri]|uniref:Arf-GAP with coiled-coil, ANK repeat and PH domain-containing protein 2 n=1 Tax=Cryptolaemus montrouzieri TaxID=559131 RepID=A0ABD2MTP1_9CUCU
MIGKIELEECLRDSPKFRSYLEEEEASIDQLEHKLDRILKICGSMVDSGKTYVAQQSLFANSLWDLSTHFREDPVVLSSLNKLIHSLQEMNKFHTTLLDQASRSILKNLTSFVKNDIKNVRDYKQHFEKISTEYDAVLLRNSHTPKNKQQEVIDVQNILLAVRSCFCHQGLDYINSITTLQSKKRHEILSTLLSYMHACSTYYHQGSELCGDLEPFFKKLSEEISAMQYETYKIEKDLENRHSIVSSTEMAPVEMMRKDGLLMEGYLFKRTSNAFKTWNRRWFYLYKNKLVYRKRSGEENETVMEEDLRLCTVKPVNEGERRFCFEVLSPSKSHMLQADSKIMYDSWIEALQRGIGAAFQRISSCDSGTESLNSSSKLDSKIEIGNGAVRNNNNKIRKAKMWEQLVKIPGNNLCCDCENPNPKWASINLGITMCIECSGVHRSLGVHYSKVRSLTLDDWEPENVKVMAELGNLIVNKVYEANVPDDFVRATPNCPGHVRETWIKAKYVDKKFVKTLPEFKSSPSQRVSRSSLMEVRKWSVRKLRRRPRSSDNPRRRKDKAKKEEKIVEDESDSAIEKDDKSPQSIGFGSERRKSVLLFGSELEKQPMNEAIDLSSDQESTGGEDNDVLEAEDISKLHPNLLLYKASAAHNLPVMCEAIALGADIQWNNAEDRGRTPLHQGVLSGSVMPCAYLILNNAKVNAQDLNQKTPLHLATQQGHTAQVCLFLKHRANIAMEDDEGKTALSMAEEKKNADIVTLLRIARLNEEMKECEPGLTGDELFNDVVRDFSHLACSHPERLQRSESPQID